MDRIESIIEHISYHQGIDDGPALADAGAGVLARYLGAGESLEALFAAIMARLPPCSLEEIMG